MIGLRSTPKDLFRMASPRKSKPSGRLPLHLAPEADDTENPTTSVGVKIARARRGRGWTLQQLSDASGVAVATLSKIENGKSGASFDTISRVAAALSLKFDDILGTKAKKFARGRRSITKAGDAMKSPATISCRRP